MHQVLITLGSLRIGSWGLMLALGILAAMGLFWLMCKRSKTQAHVQSFYSMLGLISIGFGLFGAWAFQQIYSSIAGTERNWAAFTFMGGVVFGVLTFFLGTVFFAKQSVKNDFYRICNIAVPSIFIALAFGRMGCLMGGCCYGAPTDGTWGIISGTPSVDRIPTQVFEGVFSLLMVLTLVFLLFRGKGKYNMFIGGGGYALFRFIIEFFRDDQRNQAPGNPLSPSQWQSLVLLLVVVVLFLVVVVFKKKPFTRPLKALPGGLNESLVLEGIVKKSEMAKYASTGVVEKESAAASPAVKKNDFYGDDEDEKHKPKEVEKKEFKYQPLSRLRLPFYIVLGVAGVFLIVGIIMAAIWHPVAMAFMFIFATASATAAFVLMPFSFVSMEGPEKYYDPKAPFNVSLIFRNRATGEVDYKDENVNSTKKINANEEDDDDDEDAAKSKNKDDEPVEEGGEDDDDEIIEEDEEVVDSSEDEFKD